MDFGKMFDKSIKGLLTVIAALVISNAPILQKWIVGILPDGIDPQMTIAAAVGAIIVGLANMIKHLGK